MMIISSLLNFLIVVLFGLVFWVWPQDQEVLDNWCLGQEFVGGQLGPLALAYQDWCVVRLEACDSLRLTGLTDSVHCVADTHLSLDRLELFVESDEHARVD